MARIESWHGHHMSSWARNFFQSAEKERERQLSAHRWSHCLGRRHPTLTMVVALAAARAAAARSLRQYAARAHTLEASSSYLAPRVPKLAKGIRALSVSRPHWQPTQKYSASPISDGQYHNLSNNVLDTLTEHFEQLLEEADLSGDAQEWDIECAVRSFSPYSGKEGGSRY